MNIKFEDLFKTLNIFIELLKDINKETIFKIREILGDNVLVNYENVIETNVIETKKYIQNFILNQINIILEDLNSINSFDKSTYTDFIKTNLELEKFDLEKITYIVEKLKDPEAYQLIGHKLTLDEKIGDMVLNISRFNNLGYDKNTEVEFSVLVEKYNDLLSLIDGSNCECSYDNSLLIKLDFKLPTIELEKIENLLDFQTNLPNINALLDLKINSIKESIKDIKLYGSTSEKFKKNILLEITDFTNGIINTETFDYKINQLTSNFKFFINLQLIYLDTINGYLEYVSNYVKAYNFLKDNIQVIYNIFNKSN